MEGIIGPALAEIGSQGLLGAIIIVLGIGYYLKDKKVGELRDRIEQLQEKRLADVLASKAEALEITNKVNSVIATLTDLMSKK